MNPIAGVPDGAEYVVLRRSDVEALVEEYAIDHASFWRPLPLWPQENDFARGPGDISHWRFRDGAWQGGYRQLPAERVDHEFALRNNWTFIGWDRSGRNASSDPGEGR